MTQSGDVDTERIEVLTLNSDFGEKKDYKEVIALYEKQALRDLSESEIPAGMESVVKEYFIKISE